jgi:hypothetical protein
MSKDHYKGNAQEHGNRDINVPTCKERPEEITRTEHTNNGPRKNKNVKTLIYSSIAREEKKLVEYNNMPSNTAVVLEQRHGQIRNECYRLNPQ